MGLDVVVVVERQRKDLKMRWARGLGGVGCPVAFEFQAGQNCQIQDTTVTLSYLGIGVERRRYTRANCPARITVAAARSSLLMPIDRASTLALSILCSEHCISKHHAA